METDWALPRRCCCFVFSPRSRSRATFRMTRGFVSGGTLGMESMVLRMPSSWWAMFGGRFGLLTRTSGKCTERCSVATTASASVTLTGTQTMPPQNLLGGVLYACRQTLWVRASGASRRRGLRLDFYSSRRPTCSICHPPLRLYLVSETNTKGAAQTTTSPPVSRPAPLSSSGSVAPVTVPGLDGLKDTQPGQARHDQGSLSPSSLSIPARDDHQPSNAGPRASMRAERRPPEPSSDGNRRHITRCGARPVHVPNKQQPWAPRRFATRRTPSDEPAMTLPACRPGRKGTR